MSSGASKQALLRLQSTAGVSTGPTIQRPAVGPSPTSLDQEAALRRKLLMGGSLGSGRAAKPPRAPLPSTKELDKELEEGSVVSGGSRSSRGSKKSKNSKASASWRDGGALLKGNAKHQNKDQAKEQEQLHERGKKQEWGVASAQVPSHTSQPSSAVRQSTTPSTSKATTTVPLPNPFSSGQFSSTTTASRDGFGGAGASAPTFSTGGASGTSWRGTAFAAKAGAATAAPSDFASKGKASFNATGLPANKTEHQAQSETSGKSAPTEKTSKFGISAAASTATATRASAWAKPSVGESLHSTVAPASVKAASRAAWQSQKVPTLATGTGTSAQPRGGEKEATAAFQTETIRCEAVAVHAPAAAKPSKQPAVLLEVPTPREESSPQGPSAQQLEQFRFRWQARREQRERGRIFAVWQAQARRSQHQSMKNVTALFFLRWRQALRRITDKRQLFLDSVHGIRLDAVVGEMNAMSLQNASGGGGYYSIEVPSTKRSRRSSFSAASSAVIPPGTALSSAVMAATSAAMGREQGQQGQQQSRKSVVLLHAANTSLWLGKNTHPSGVAATAAADQNPPSVRELLCLATDAGRCRFVRQSCELRRLAGLSVAPSTLQYMLHPASTDSTPSFTATSNTGISSAVKAVLVDSGIGDRRPSHRDASGSEGAGGCFWRGQLFLKVALVTSCSVPGVWHDGDCLLSNLLRSALAADPHYFPPCAGIPATPMAAVARLSRNQAHKRQLRMERVARAILRNPPSCAHITHSCLRVPIAGAHEACHPASTGGRGNDTGISTRGCLTALLNLSVVDVCGVGPTQPAGSARANSKGTGVGAAADAGPRLRGGDEALQGTQAVIIAVPVEQEDSQAEGDGLCRALAALLPCLEGAVPFVLVAVDYSDSQSSSGNADSGSAHGDGSTAPTWSEYSVDEVRSVQQGQQQQGLAAGTESSRSEGLQKVGSALNRLKALVSRAVPTFPARVEDLLRACLLLRGSRYSGLGKCTQQQPERLGLPELTRGGADAPQRRELAVRVSACVRRVMSLLAASAEPQVLVARQRVQDWVVDHLGRADARMPSSLPPAAVEGERQVDRRGASSQSERDVLFIDLLCSVARSAIEALNSCIEGGMDSSAGWQQLGRGQGGEGERQEQSSCFKDIDAEQASLRSLPQCRHPAADFCCSAPPVSLSQPLAILPPLAAAGLSSSTAIQSDVSIDRSHAGGGAPGGGVQVVLGALSNDSLPAGSQYPSAPPATALPRASADAPYHSAASMASGEALPLDWADPARATTMRSHLHAALLPPWPASSSRGKSHRGATEESWQLQDWQRLCSMYQQSLQQLQPLTSDASRRNANDVPNTDFERGADQLASRILASLEGCLVQSDYQSAGRAGLLMQPLWLRADDRCVFSARQQAEYSDGSIGDGIESFAAEAQRDVSAQQWVWEAASGALLRLLRSALLTRLERVLNGSPLGLSERGESQDEKGLWLRYRYVWLQHPRQLIASESSGGGHSNSASRSLLWNSSVVNTSGIDDPAGSEGPGMASAWNNSYRDSHTHSQYQHHHTSLQQGLMQENRQKQSKADGHKSGWAQKFGEYDYGVQVDYRDAWGSTLRSKRSFDPRNPYAQQQQHQQLFRDEQTWQHAIGRSGVSVSQAASAPSSAIGSASGSWSAPTKRTRLDQQPDPQRVMEAVTEMLRSEAAAAAELNQRLVMAVSGSGSQQIKQAHSPSSFSSSGPNAYNTLVASDSSPAAKLAAPTDDMDPLEYIAACRREREAFVQQ